MTTNERELLDALKQAAAALAVINNAEDFRTIRERAEERALEPGRISTREMGD